MINARTPAARNYATLVGGGLSVVANAPNPAGQSILSRYFPSGIAPLGLFVAALPATVIIVVCCLWAR
jgi:hypothetical protein